MKGRVQWDEANIVEIESNKPIRQKITEPKTSYHPMIYDDDLSLSLFRLFSVSPTFSLSPRGRSFDSCFDELHHAKELRNVLNDVASSSKNSSQRMDSRGWSWLNDDTEPMDESEGSDIERSESFKEHRKAHYNEFQMVKELRSSGSFYGEYAEIDDSVKTSKAEVTISPKTPGKVSDRETADGAADVIMPGKSSSSSS